MPLKTIFSGREVFRLITEVKILSLKNTLLQVKVQEYYQQTIFKQKLKYLYYKYIYTVTVSDTSLHMLFPSTVRLRREARTPGSCIMRGNTSLLRTEVYFLFTETRGWEQEGLADEWRRNRRGGLNSLWTVHLPVLTEETVWFKTLRIIYHQIKTKIKYLEIGVE